MTGIFLPAQLAVKLGDAMRALGNKADRGEVRSYYVVYIDEKGQAHEAFKLDPEKGNRDVNILGNVMCDHVEKLQDFVKSKQKIHASM